MPPNNKKLYETQEEVTPEDSLANVLFKEDDPHAATNGTVPSSTVQESSTPSPSLVFGRFILEPAVFLVFFAINLPLTVFQNQLLYQACTDVFHYNENDCKPLLGTHHETNASKEIESIVQPFVSRYLMAMSLIDCIIPAILSLFIGGWSDKFGRKPIILATFGGFFCSLSITCVLAFISIKYEFNPWIYIIGTIPMTLMGGVCAMLTGIYCYISDVAHGSSKALRMFLNDAALGLGTVLGNVVSGYLFPATNMATVLCLSALLFLMATLYVYFFTVDVIKSPEMGFSAKMRELFRFDLVKDLIHTCIKRRPNFDRTIIWLTMLSLIMTNFVTQGESNVVYLFMRKQFGVSVKDYTTYIAISAVIQMVGGVIGLKLCRQVFNLSLVSLSLISLGCCIMQSTVRAAAAYWWEIYLGASLGLLNGVLGSMLLAIISYITPSVEIGKVYAVTRSMQTITPLGAAPLYTSVYNSTLHFYPGFYNIVSVALYLITFMMMSTIFGINIRHGILNVQQPNDA